MHINPAVIMPQPYRGDSAIRSSVCLPVGLSHGAAALGTLVACSLATAGHQRCVDCGPVRGRTQIRRESNSHRRGHIVSPPPRPGTITCYVSI